MEWRFGTPRLTIASGKGEAGATVALDVTNGGGMAADTSVLLFLSFLGRDGSEGTGPRATIAGSGCSERATSTDLVQRLAGYQRTGQLAPGASANLSFDLRLNGSSKSAWAGFGDPEPPCGAYALRLGHDQPESATFVLEP